MINRRYNPRNLSAEETPFKGYFDRLVLEFGNKYEIWVRNEDFHRTIAGGLVKRQSEVVVIIYFKYGSINIPNPISEIVIEKARQYLSSATVGDLRINVPPGA